MLQRKGVFEDVTGAYQAAPRTSTRDLGQNRLCEEWTLQGAAPRLAQGLVSPDTAFTLKSETR